MYQFILANKTVYNFLNQIEMDAFKHKLYLDDREKRINHHEMVERKHLITFVSLIVFFLILIPFSCLLLFKGLYRICIETRPVNKI